MFIIVHHVGEKRQSSSDHIEVKPKKMRVNGKKVILTVVLLSHCMLHVSFPHYYLCVSVSLSV